MTERETKYCDNCGAVCKITDTYCKQCSQAFPKESMTIDSVISGIDDNELRAYIGDNAPYYIKQFRKAKNKEWFMQFNFWAFFFGPTWFWYRKMNEIALKYTALVLGFWMIINLLVPLVFYKPINDYYEAKEEYSAYINSGGDILTFGENGYYRVPEYDAIMDNLEKKQNVVMLIYVFSNILIYSVNFIPRLYSNCLYKRHIEENISEEKGGKSVQNAFLGLLLFNGVKYVTSFIVLLIPYVARFSDAVGNMYLWL